MTQLVQNIESDWWSLSAQSFGEVVQDAADINQSIAFILMTVPGSDPFRPEFGSYLYEYIDTPVNLATVAIENEILRSLEQYEERVNIEEVTPSIDEDGELKILISWTLKRGSLSGDTEISIGVDSSLVSGSTAPAVANFVNPETQAVIKNIDWQLSTEAFGSVVQGRDDISQSILLILSSIKGSDPFRPEFGSDIWDYIDQPLEVAAVEMVAAIKRDVTRWEPRVEISKVSYLFQVQERDNPGAPLSGIVFDVGWKLAGGDLEGQTEVLFGFINDLSNTSPLPEDIIISILGTESEEGVTTELGEYIEQTGN